MPPTGDEYSKFKGCKQATIFVEGGCQPVLAGGQSVLVDTNLISFSLVLVLACSF